MLSSKYNLYKGISIYAIEISERDFTWYFLMVWKSWTEGHDGRATKSSKSVKPDFLLSDTFFSIIIFRFSTNSYYYLNVKSSSLFNIEINSKKSPELESLMQKSSVSF